MAAALRLGYRYEAGDIDDWHYRGLDTTHVLTAVAAALPTAVLLDSGPRRYRVHIATMAVRWRLVEPQGRAVDSQRSERRLLPTPRPTRSAPGCG